MKINKNLVIFITGAGSGFGLDSSIRFIALGCKVIMADIQYTREAQQFIQDESNLYFLNQFDVTNEQEVSDSVDLAIQYLQKVDVLLNCAGVVSLGFMVNRKGEIGDNSEIWRCLNINLIGTINVSKYIAKYMIKQDQNSDRVIINVSSVAGIEASRGMIAYSISKGAVIGITLPMARDLGRYGIRVVTLAPQIFKTPMGNLNPVSASQIMIKNTALERLGEPSEFSDAVVSIVGSSYLTGCVIRLDGGLRVPHI